MTLRANVLAWLAGAAMLAACDGVDTADGVETVASATAACTATCTEGTREQDGRTFIVVESMLPFDALAGAAVETDRWWGVLDGAGYRIEVPKNWNGKLVMYAHGYVGATPYLTVTNPTIRRHLIENGYAWAASSYSRNYYDARAGLEDTNALARAFKQIAKANGRKLEKPTAIYITGHSMGGHIAAAAMEKETKKTINNKVNYSGAVPMCANVGDTELFDYFAAYQYAAQQLAGYPATAAQTPESWASLMPYVNYALFSSFSASGGVVLRQTSEALALREAVKNLTGGHRPAFYTGFQVYSNQAYVWGSFSGDGTIGGILEKNSLDTTDVLYQFDSDPALSTAEAYFNAGIFRIAADADANALRCDGLRWIPKVNGFFRAPVVTLHTLGDLFVPFSMEQIYRQRAVANHSGDFLVQRAIRGAAHCDFTIAEQVAAFDDMVAWHTSGVMPAGDEVLDPVTVANGNYGCTFTNSTPSVDDNPSVLQLRAVIGYYEPCAAQ